MTTNQREFKFRAWNTKEKQMSDPFTFDDFDTTYFIPKGRYLYGDEMEVMQFTGLLDSEGKEVYEGDIIECTSCCPHEVIFKLDHGGNVLGGMPTFYLSGLTAGYQWTGREKLLGNIYQNPELLGTS